MSREKLRKHLRWLKNKTDYKYRTVVINGTFVAYIFRVPRHGRSLWVCVDVLNGEPTRINRICNY